MGFCDFGFVKRKTFEREFFLLFGTKRLYKKKEKKTEERGGYVPFVS